MLCLLFFVQIALAKKSDVCYNGHKKGSFRTAEVTVMIMKHMSWILAAILLAGAMVSCGGETTTTADTMPSDTVGETAAVTEEEPFDPFAALPEKDYEGFDFHMLIRNNQRWIEDMYIEEASGDIVDDAIFERNSLISERFNVTISYQPSSHDNTETDAVKTILAGDDAYSLVMAHGRAAFSYANQGLVLDWNTDLP